MCRVAWQATVHGVARVGHNLETKPPPILIPRVCVIVMVVGCHSWKSRGSSRREKLNEVGQKETWIFLLVLTLHFLWLCFKVCYLPGKVFLPPLQSSDSERSKWFDQSDFVEQGWRRLDWPPASPYCAPCPNTKIKITSISQAPHRNRRQARARILVTSSLSQSKFCLFLSNHRWYWPVIHI